MSNPDLSQDRELVELAKVIRETYHAHLGSAEDSWLAAAEAARTHLGSAYVLPPATEQNAERLARAKWDVERLAINAATIPWAEMQHRNKDPRMVMARQHLRALHAAFAPREPKGQECQEANGCHGVCLPCDPDYTATDDVAKALNAEEKPVRDAVSRDEQREYEALVLQFAAAMAGDDSAEHVINLAVELADQYLEWRKMEREEFKRCKS